MGLIIFALVVYILLRPPCPACPPPPETPPAPPESPSAPTQPEPPLTRPQPRAPSPVAAAPVAEKNIFVLPRASPESDSGITQHSLPRGTASHGGHSSHSSHSGHSGHSGHSSHTRYGRKESSSSGSTVQPRVRKRAKGASYSASYSGGSAIDLYSDEYRSDTEERPDVYSPQHTETEKRSRGEAYFTMGNTCQRALDVVTFSDFDLYLESPTSVKVVGDSARQVRFAVALKQLATFSDQLYALGVDGCMYELRDEDFERGEWRWTRSDWLPDAVVWVSSSYDDKNLWVQTKNKGYLYNENHIAVEEESMRGKRRVYGYTYADYAVVDDDAGCVRYGDLKVAKARDGLLDSHNRLHVLMEKDAGSYSRICFVRWTPTYVGK